MESKCKMCGTCCSYVTVALDPPEDKVDYDEIIWFLHHKNIMVYIDDEGDWYIELQTPCKHLEGGKCTNYENRPVVCREHDPSDCENNGEGSPYKVFWTEADSFIDYLKSKNIKY